MNQGLHRVVFNRRRGLRMAVAECARSAAPGQARGAARAASGVASFDARAAQPLPTALALAAALALLAPEALLAQSQPAAGARAPVVFASQVGAPRQNLPQPYGSTRRPDGSFVNDPSRRSFIDPQALASGVAWTVNGQTAVLNQAGVDRLVLNWDSFDIGAGYTVRFEQNPDPTRAVSALNRIWSADPSLILGRLEANREVILVNGNGVYFGRGAVVDTGRFVATTLGLGEGVFEKGLRSITNGAAAFSANANGEPATQADSAVTVEEGALIRSAAGGDVLLVAPRVSNRGRIETPGGQAVLAAGERVYLMSSSDPAQRGLIVAVDPVREGGVPDPTLGIVENAAQGRTGVDDGTGRLVERINEIRAEGGSINLVGLTVRQAGQLNATTAVKGANGTILLQAMSGSAALAGGPESVTASSLRGLTVESGSTVRVAAGGGTVELASGSLTAVRPDASGRTQLDAEVFNPSRVLVEGADIRVGAGARIEAPGGRVDLLAAQMRASSPLFNRGLTSTPASGDTSRILVEPGARITVAGLQGVSVAGERNQGQQRLFRIELADAPVQRDGPLYRSEVYFDLRDASRIGAANVTGAASSVRRTAEELSTRGGQITVASEGSVVLGQDATLDVSGGTVVYTPALLRNTVVLRDGRPVQFSRLAGAARVDGVAPATADTPVPGYVEGQAGGRLTVDARALALAAELQGGVTTGDRQLSGLSAPAAPATLQVGQSLGGGYTLAALSLGAAPAAPLDAAVLAGAARPAGPTVVSLADVQAGGFGGLVLQAASITQDTPASLSLGLGGQLNLRAERIAIDGRFSAPGGSIELSTTRAETNSALSGLGDIVLGDDTRLDTAGRWTNQLAGVGGAATAPVQLAGGSVRVSAAHSLRAEPGAALDVSAGARLDRNGTLTRGTAGSINLAIGRSELLQPTLQLQALTLSGHDFSGGGRLTLGLPAVVIGSSDAATLAPGVFSRGGFGNIAITSYGDITVQSGTTLAPVLDNWVLDAGHRQTPSGPMATAAAPAELDSALADRRAVSLSLTANRPLNPAQNQPGSRVVVERGARIELEPGASLTLAATRDVWVGATGGDPGQTSLLQAPGGTLQISVLGTRGASSFASASEDPVGFLPDQGIWLGAGAQLTVAGTARTRQAAVLPVGSSLGASGDSGTVWGGGTVTLDAQRGYVVAQAGSRIALDGAAALLDVPAAGGATWVARPAGTLRVNTPEGFALQGELSAQAPRDAEGRVLADGGRVELSLGLGGVNTFTSGAAYPGSRFDASGRPLANPVPAPREIALSVGAVTPLPTGAGAGGNLLSVLGNGQGGLDAAGLMGAGFEGLRLGAGDAVRVSGTWSAYFPLGVVIDSPALVADPGAQVALGGAYASLGDRSLARQGDAPDRQAAPDASPRADTRLRVAAPTIELVGRSALRGFSDVSLDAGGQPGGELRYSAVAPALTGIAGTGEGSLAFAGTLTLTAAQQYSTTGSRFVVQGLPAAGPGDAGSRLVLATGAGGAAPVAPLSTFGSLGFEATDIVHGGVVRQPFGQVTMNAERTLELQPGSITSVSGDGLTALFGATDNLSQWLQPSGVYAERLPLEKGVTLRGATVDVAAGAQVDASGGGTVLAWEFFPGVGGSRDVFAADGVFAVLPDHAQAPALALNGGVQGLSQPGQQWVLTMPTAGLAPGAYTVLPARYALLAGALPQGAFLVRRATDTARAPLGAPVAQDDGSVIVTGYLRDVGSVHAGVPGERWVVESPQVFNARSEVRLSSVGTLLEQRARSLGRPLPLLPQDAGRIELRGSGSAGSRLEGTLDLAAAGGRAGLLDLAGEHVAVLDDLGRAPAGALAVAVDTLSGSGAGSVLLGGVRTEARQADGSTAVQVSATGTQRVTLDSPGRPLRAEELLVTATDRVVVTPGTPIVATSEATLGPRSLVTQGDGALLVVGANPVTVQRSDAAGSAGQLELGAGVRLDAAQVALDATRSLQLHPTVQLDAGALTLGGRRIVVGADSGTPGDVTALSGALLQAVQQVPDLTLVGYQGIDFVGTQDWARRDADGRPTQVLDRLVLNAPQLVGLADAQGQPARVDLAAHGVTLLAGVAAPGGVPLAAEAGSQLRLEALPRTPAAPSDGFSVGAGDIGLGFAATEWRSSADVVLRGSGSVTAAGDLTVSAARLTAATGVQQVLRTPDGLLQVQSKPGARSLGERVGQGAQVGLQGARLVQDGWIDLPGGQLALQSTGTAADGAALSLGAGSLTSVAGFTLSGAGRIGAVGHAGQLSLQADQGRIALAGTLDVGAATQGDGGVLSLSASGVGGGLDLAPGAQLRGQAGAGAGDRGGQLRADVRTLGDADALVRAASDGGFGGEFALRVRSGDVQIGEDIRAARIRISSDGGRLGIDGATLDARSAQGGVVQLHAGADLRLGDTVVVDASSSAAGGSGGDVLLASAGGRVSLAPGARVDAGGDDGGDGRIVLRAPRGADNASVQVDALDTRRLQAGELVIEGVRTWSQVVVGGESRGISAIGAGNSSISGSGAARTGTLGQAAVRADNNAFMAAAPGVLSQLGVDAADSGRVRVAAGVEVRSSGNLSLAADWTLDAAADRPGGQPGLLTLRAAGSLVFNGSLSDGFVGAAPTAALGTSSQAWSYRLVAGADLSAADPMATLAPAALAPDSGDVLVNGGRLVRTGAGSIEVAAGRDIRFGQGTGSAASGMVYVAGRRAADLAALQSSLFAGQAVKPVFTEGGGRVELRAGRDVVAPEATQLINNWLWRSGLPSTRAGEEGWYDRGSQLAWWAEFPRLRQTVGAFGGGGLRVQAGRDVVNLQALVPTSGWADSRDASSANLQVRGGGDLQVEAGRNVLGGQYLVGRGSGRIAAGGDIGGLASNLGPVVPLLAVLSGSGWRLSARDELSLGTAFNPTATPTGTADSRGPVSGFFYTWDGGAGLSLSANAGSVVLQGAPSAAQLGRLGLFNGAETGNYFRVLPADLAITAAGGDIRLLGEDSVGAVLYPSATGSLALWAGRDLVLGTESSTPSFAQADSPLAAWPSWRSPISRTAPQLAFGGGLVNTTLGDQIGRSALRAQAEGQASLQAQGSIVSWGDASWLLAQQAELSAGQDLISLRLVGQNLRDGDETRVRAGRNLLAGAQGLIDIGGPGALEVQAGRGIDLGASEGIVTSGNRRNANLPATGASVRVRASAAGTLDLEVLRAQYLTPVASVAELRTAQPRAVRYRQALLDYVRGLVAGEVPDFDAAWAVFTGLSPELQARFGRQVLALEFRARYLDAPAPTRDGVREELRVAFERQKAQVLEAGQAALARGEALELPGRERLQGDALRRYLAELQGLGFEQIDTAATVQARLDSLQRVSSGWRDHVAASLGRNAAELDALTSANPADPLVQRWRSLLASSEGAVFERYQSVVLTQETSNAATAASQFGRRALPLRLALFEQGFQAAELGGAGSFVAQPVWPGTSPLLRYEGAFELTQSGIVTQRGGAIELINPGGAINVGLKDSGVANRSPKGVIALGGGNIFGYARDDFQVNTQRVFIVGQGNMAVWSSRGDIDSGRGANTAVAAPPLAARRSTDGVVFEVPATTTGSGLGILEDASGRRSGSIGLFPAFGEIVALDAFIRAPQVVLGATVKGADNLQSASVSGSAAAVAAPPVAVAAPATPAAAAETRPADNAAAAGGETRQRNGLLTVELLGLGAEAACSEDDEKRGQCKRPPRCTEAQKAAGQCP